MGEEPRLMGKAAGEGLHSPAQVARHQPRLDAGREIQSSLTKGVC